MEDKFFQNIDKYVYDECSKEEMDLFLEHLKGCTKCKEEYELSCSIRDLLHKMPKLEPPADFSKLVNERLDKELTPARKIKFVRAGYRKYSAVAACLVLATALGIEGTRLHDNAPIESTTVSDQGLQFVPDTHTEVNPPEDMQVLGNIPESSAAVVSVAKAPVVPASTIKPADAVPAHTLKPDNMTAALVTAAPQVTYSPETDTWNVPEHLDPTKNVVLASSVEKTYQISGIDPQYTPKKERDLAKEFSLLETTNSGVIVANTANMSSLDGVRFGIDEETKNSKSYGVGSGSIFISSNDKPVVDELITKYISVQEGGCCFFTEENFNNFKKEIDSKGIDYEERIMTETGGNVAIKVIAG